MKKYISIFTIVIGLLLNAQTDYKPMLIYNFSSYDLQIEVNTCNENSVFDGTSSGIVYPAALKSPSTFTVASSGGTFSFDYISPTGNSGLSFRGTDVPGPGTGFWQRKITSTGSYSDFPTNLAQSLYGTNSKWWYAKLGITYSTGGSTGLGNLGNWGNTVNEDGYSVIIGDLVTAEWIEVTENPDYPEYYTTYIIISDF